MTNIQVPAPIEEKIQKEYPFTEVDEPNKMLKEITNTYNAIARHAARFGHGLALQWIPLEERLPDFDTWVLCYCKIYGFYIGAYQRILDTNFGNWCDGKDLGVLPPICWMPLPQPPQQ